jgi:integrase
MTAEGSVYQRRDGRWVAQYKDAKGKTRYLYRKTKAEAKKALREALRDRDDNIVPPDKLTVGIYLDEWLEDRRETVSPRTWRVQESILRRHVKPQVGTTTLAKLTSKDIRSLYRGLRGLPRPTLSTKVVNKSRGATTWATGEPPARWSW